MNAAATAHDEAILRVLAQALSALDLHDARLVIALADLGDIDLPEGAGLAGQAERLAPLGPFYLAYRLEQAGLLRTADLVAGLYVSGSITASIDTAGQLIRKFWQERHQRLSEAERVHLFDTVFEQPLCDALLEAFMRSIIAQTDNADVPDIREAVALEQSGLQLADFLEARAGGIVAFAARDIIAAVSDAVRFLKEPELLAAFSARNLWDLVRTVDSAGNPATGSVQAYVDLGKSGQTILLWLAETARSGSIRLAPSAPNFQDLAVAAATWLQAYHSLRAASRPPALPSVA